ncbi:MAG: rhomboid family intramembrane serine protease [Gammaproteobacteria bacterium]
MNAPAPPRAFPSVTYALIAINVALYLIQVVKGANGINPSPEAMIGWGANVAGYTLVDQPWRLLTSMFLHIGLLHLAVNMYMLFAFGALVERRFGHVRFLLVYLLAGLVGSLASALWHADPFRQVVAAGASGALMGLCGAYLADWIAAQWHNDPHDEISTRGPLVQTIVINLVIGSVTPGIDNACHVGGLIGGFLVGGAFALVPYEYGRVKKAVAAALITGVALGGIYAKLQAKPSEGLAAIREVRAAEQAEQEQKDRAARDEAELARQIADDRKHGPRKVSAEIAAGSSIELPSWAGSLLLIPGGARVAITDASEGTLRLIDLAARKATLEVKGARVGPKPQECSEPRCFPNNASAVALAPDGRIAYVASMVLDGVGVVDLDSGKMVGSFKTGSQPRAIVVNRAGARAWVLNNGDNSVVAVDLAAGKATGKHAVVGSSSPRHYHPVGMWLAAGEKELWVMDESASRMVVLDAATLDELGEVVVTSGYMNGAHVDPARGKAWVVGVDAMDQIDLASRKIEKTARFCTGVNMAAVAFNRDASLLAIAEPGRFLRVVKLATGATVAAYPFTGDPVSLRYAPDDSKLYLVANSHEPRLMVFDTGVSMDLDEVVSETQPERLCEPLRPVRQ